LLHPSTKLTDKNKHSTYIHFILNVFTDIYTSKLKRNVYCDTNYRYNNDTSVLSIPTDTYFDFYLKVIKALGIRKVDDTKCNICHIHFKNVYAGLNKIAGKLIGSENTDETALKETLNIIYAIRYYENINFNFNTLDYTDYAYYKAPKFTIHKVRRIVFDKNWKEPTKNYIIIPTYKRTQEIYEHYKIYRKNFLNANKELLYIKQSSITNSYNTTLDGRQADYIKNNYKHDVMGIYYLPMYMVVDVFQNTTFESSCHVEFKKALKTSLNTFLFHFARRLYRLHRNKKYIFDYNINNFFFGNLTPDDINKFVYVSERYDLDNALLINASNWPNILETNYGIKDNGMLHCPNPTDDLLATYDLIAFLCFIREIVLFVNNDELKVFPKVDTNYDFTGKQLGTVYVKALYYYSNKDFSFLYDDPETDIRGNNQVFLWYQIMLAILFNGTPDFIDHNPAKYLYNVININFTNEQRRSEEICPKLDKDGLNLYNAIINDKSKDATLKTKIKEFVKLMLIYFNNAVFTFFNNPFEQNKKNFSDNYKSDKTFKIHNSQKINLFPENIKYIIENAHGEINDDEINTKVTFNKNKDGVAKVETDKNSTPPPPPQITFKDDKQQQHTGAITSYIKNVNVKSDIKFYKYDLSFYTGNENLNSSVQLATAVNYKIEHYGRTIDTSKANVTENIYKYLPRYTTFNKTNWFYDPADIDKLIKNPVFRNVLTDVNYHKEIPKFRFWLFQQSDFDKLDSKYDYIKTKLIKKLMTCGLSVDPIKDKESIKNFIRKNPNRMYKLEHIQLQDYIESLKHCNECIKDIQGARSFYGDDTRAETQQKLLAEEENERIELKKELTARIEALNKSGK
jgi:hypothetical protein